MAFDSIVDDKTSTGSDASSSAFTSAKDDISPASDAMMQRLQDSYDQTTRLMLSLKKAAQEMVRCVSITESGRAMVRRGQYLSKSLQAKTDDIDEMLVMPRTMVKTCDDMQKLQAAVPPYTELERVYAELMALHALRVPKQRAEATKGAE